jgi:exoribonuclease-2
MSLEGRIVEFLDAEELRVAYVRKQERDRLHLIDPRGRNLTVNGDRVVVIHRIVSEGEFPVLARQISEKVAAHQSEVDVELLWQSLGGKQREMELAELAELFFTEATPEAASALFRALSKDNLFFKRKGAQFLPRSEEQISTEITRRQRQQEHEKFREHAIKLFEQLLKKDGDIPDDAGFIIDRLQNWLRYRTGDEIGALLEERVGAAKARDTAYDILLKAGRLDASTDRFLVTAGIEPAFSSQLIEAAAEIRPYTHAEPRVDYRNEAAFTIDDEDTREIDDALTLRRQGDEILIGIHIADVSAFVTKGDPLDIESSHRSSTIYLPSVSVRMFPESLSTDLASLRAGVPRPAFTVEVRFDSQKNRIGYRIALSTINVCRRLSYDEADSTLESDETLHTLFEIAKQLQEARAKRGAITFRRPELKVRVRGDDIEVTKINPNSPSRVLVSEMMILANGLSADFASGNNIPIIYRTQEPREALAIEETPALEALAFERLRKTFKRSRLSLTPGLHSGLGLNAYTQASSPIRRYADLVTQRQFTAMLTSAPVPYGREELLQILVTAETAEQEIRAIEDRSTNYWLLKYLDKYKKQDPLSALILDHKGNIELEDYYLRAKISGLGKPEPGQRITVRIDTIDPAKGDVRFRTA